MKRRGVLMACVLGGAALGCSTEALDTQSVDEVASPIVNGNVTTGDPAVVYLSGGCTGTLISPSVVLTARHCTSTGGNKDIFFGSDNDEQGTWIDSEDIVVYTPGSGIGSGDLAVILLSEPGPADWIEVNDQDLDPYVGDDVRMVGFGRTSTNGGGSGTKREGMTTLQSLNSSGTVMFTGGDPSGHCFGDSGGPKFMEIDGKEIIIGVTSYVKNGCGGFSNDGSASTHTHYEWIMDYVQEHDPPQCGEDRRCAADCDAVDPDCPCIADGFCSDLCLDWTTDVDCAGCEDDGECRMDCPVVDNDCCIENGECVEICGQLDPDCVPDEPVEPIEPAEPEDNDHAPAAPVNTEQPPGLEGAVTCAVAAPGRHDATPWLLALWVAPWIRRRRD